MAIFKRQQTTTPTSSALNTHSVFDDATEQRIIQIGSSLLDQARSKKQSWLSTAFWSDKLMDWAMQDEAFKIQLFRFVDTFRADRSSSIEVCQPYTAVRCRIKVHSVRTER